MSNNTAIANRIREVFLNGKWIANTNFKEQITEIDWQQAVYKIDNLNTIALLTYHINYYVAGLLRVLDGGPLEIKDRYSFNLPEIKSEADWNKLVIDFLDNAEKFAGKVETLSDEILYQIFVDEKYGNYLRNIEAVIEHSYYHLGQITLLKKLISQKFNRNS